MTSLDVMLKGTDDDASSSFFHLKVSLRHRLKRLRRLLLVRGRAPSRFGLMPEAAEKVLDKQIRRLFMSRTE
ncbi:hypothetical protein [Salisediminibacterium halotolerans]|uniref:hypothetical protein n=1 Tax=Salisediminibacterium halotolerans TaxID=517425 RepID=UPI000EB22C63|nr:hypothetical protein [Salisediminibacterium halotolerans]